MLSKVVLKIGLRRFSTRQEFDFKKFEEKQRFAKQA
jgi:hypothetical protein